MSCNSGVADYDGNLAFCYCFEAEIQPTVHLQIQFNLQAFLARPSEQGAFSPDDCTTVVSPLSVDAFVEHGLEPSTDIDFRWDLLMLSATLFHFSQTSVHAWQWNALKFFLRGPGPWHSDSIYLLHIMLQCQRGGQGCHVRRGCLPKDNAIPPVLASASRHVSCAGVSSRYH